MKLTDISRKSSSRTSGAKPGTKMHNAPEPSLDELLWTIAMAPRYFRP